MTEVSAYLLKEIRSFHEVLRARGYGSDKPDVPSVYSDATLGKCVEARAYLAALRDILEGQMDREKLANGRSDLWMDMAEQHDALCDEIAPYDTEIENYESEVEARDQRGLRSWYHRSVI